MATQKKKMSVKKKAAIATAGVLSVALLVGGAFAWTDYSQSARNVFKGNVAADVLLHDDFNGTNKDVYVENTGESGVRVRVKFAEYLQIGNNSVLPAFGENIEDEDYARANPNNVSTWQTHQFTNADAANVCSGGAADTHDYYTWNMSGARKQYLAGVTEADSNGRGGLSQDAFDKLTVGAEFTLGTITTSKENTLPTNAPMMLSEWLGMDATARTAKGACWLLDTDGWAYWSAALQPGTATNLLLDEVLLKDDANPYDNWVYNIDVQLQAASLNEMDHWYMDGTNEPVASPDNSVATTSADGYKYIQLVAGDYITPADGLTSGADGAMYVSLGSNVYQLAKADESGYVADPDAEPIIAGMDGIPGNIPGDDNDDNVLAGRSVEWGGAIKVASINTTDMTYTIEGAGDDYVVTSGIDKKLGTYDDIITSKTGALGQYDIDDDADLEYIGWQYLGGNLDNMFVITEYVLDNTLVTSATDDSTYAGSLLQSKMTELYTSFGAPAVVKKIELDMETPTQSNYVYTCIKDTHAVDDHTTGGACSFGLGGPYYTSVAAQTNISDTYFFAPSINEFVAAYGDGASAIENAYRRAQAAPKWLRDDVNSVGNYPQTAYADGDGNTITTTHYWLRTPGYQDGFVSYVGSTGPFMTSHGTAATTTVGARPACYMDLSGSTTAGS